jgi:quercetin dioxygenase-like cupin family protein
MSDEQAAGNEFVKEGLELEKLVDYQPSTVVSKTILKKGSGTITLFAFGQGEKLSEHTAPFDALVHVLDGVAEISIDGKAYKLSKGEMILMPADIPHAVAALENFKMLLVMLKQDAS